MGRNSSYLAGLSISFHGSKKKFNQWVKKKLLKFFLSSTKIKEAINFLNFFFFSLPEIDLVLKGLIHHDPNLPEWTDVITRNCPSDHK